MIIKELRLKNFGKFHNKTIELKEGINLIYGPNEAGKSTIHAFIGGMLFGIEKMRGKASKDDLYSKYEPLDTPSLYHGSMDIMIGNKEYRLLRNFNKNEKSFTVTRLDTGRELAINNENYSDFYEGLTESKYTNTISIGQLKAKTDKGLSDELRNYITNLSLSKTNEVDVTKALLQLNNRKKEIEKNKLEEKTQYIEEQIKKGFLLEEHKDKLTLNLRELEQKVNDIRISLDDKKDTNIRIDMLSSRLDNGFMNQSVIVREKFLVYKEYEDSRIELKEKQELIEHEIELLEYEYKNPNHIKSSLDVIQEFTQEQIELEGVIQEELSKKEELLTLKHRHNLMLIIPLATLAIFIFFVVHRNIMGVMISLLTTIMIGILIRIVRSKDNKRIRNKDLIVESLRNKIKTINKNIDKVLHSNEVGSLEELKTQYNNCILWEKEYNYKENNRKENEYNINLLRNKMYNLKNEIHGLIYKSGYPITSEVHEYSLNDTLIEEVLSYYESKYYEENIEYERVSSTYEQYRIELERIKWELDLLEENEDDIITNQNLLLELKKQKNEQEKELKAIELSIGTILDISVNIHDSFGRELNKFVSNLSCHLTGGQYNNLKVDDKLDIKVGTKDLFLPLSKLSAGTIEQVYLALRLGIASLMFKGKNMPILLDDSFALYDDERTKHALKLLSDKNMGQVIIFTCHNREKLFLNELGINHHFITLDKK